MLDHIHTLMLDRSGFQNNGIYPSNNTLRNPGCDIIQGPYPTVNPWHAMLFNGTSDSVRVPAQTEVNNPDGSVTIIPNLNLQMISPNTTGFSVHINSKPTDLAHDRGKRRVIMSKIDDPNNGWVILNDQNGDIIFLLMKAGSMYQKIWTGGATVDVWRKLVFTFDNAVSPIIATPGALRIYRDGVADSAATTGLTGSGAYTAAGYTATGYNVNAGEVQGFNTTDYDLYIGRSAQDLNKGYFKGGLQDFRFSYKRVLNSTQNTNLWTNKMSVSNIAQGAVPLTNIWYITAFQGYSYTTTSYTATSYTVGP